MTRLAVITPSYAPDFELCRDLNRTILRHCPPEVVHEIIVPDRDAGLFAEMAGERTLIRCVSDYLPRELVKVPSVNFWVNMRRPYPPVRGWIVQQIVKLEAAARADADVVLVVDSDILFVRPVVPESYLADGQVVLYRADDAIGPELPRHVRWHAVARRLLDLPPTDSGRLPDYISTPVAWDPEVLGHLLLRVETVARRPWQRVVGAQRHFSEMILYGVFVDHVLGQRTAAQLTDDMRCGVHWDELALDQAGVRRLLGTMGPDATAIMISAKSGTPVESRRAALADWERSQP